MISGFTSQVGFTFVSVDAWCSALVTLPSLEKVVFHLQEPDTEDRRDLVNLKLLKELLQTPALRFVTFYFTDRLCHVVAQALEEGSAITDINFDDDCTFPDGGSAIIANALKRNATVTDVDICGDCDEPLYNSLAAVLLCNSTLQNIALQLSEIACGPWLSSICLSLGMNTTLTSHITKTCDEFGDELCAAITSGLAKKSTLEILSLSYMVPSDDDSAFTARNALSFLRTNSTLKTLTVMFERVREESL
jgi:hypothetical protein